MHRNSSYNMVCGKKVVKFFYHLDLCFTGTSSLWKYLFKCVKASSLKMTKLQNKYS